MSALKLSKFGHLEATLEVFEELLLESIRVTDQRLADEWEEKLPKLYQRRCDERLLDLMQGVSGAFAEV